MEKYLITATLLDAWKYLFTEYGNMEDFLSTLNREERETTKAQIDGYKFEDWAIENYEPTQNGQYQVKLYKTIKSKYGTEYLLYGRLDCLKNGVVYDYKHTSSYDVGKFFNRCQTSVYLDLVPEAKEMIYIIGTDKPKYIKEMKENGNPYYIFTEKYLREEVKPIDDIISNFEEWLKKMNLWQIYKEKWLSNKE